jgi:predicted AAA+ superfamily ATPase
MEYLDKLLILDEVHRAPGLFPVLGGLIDQARRMGRASGQYLLLGSASLDVLHQSGETLAGRIAYLALGPLSVLETGPQAMDALWLRGGFPQSLNAPLRCPQPALARKFHPHLSGAGHSAIRSPHRR